ncbi:MAG TPA: DUF2892 domain-containing protein [Candidatus Limnocylindria bacterium]|nr:DUF2892 domain-containing protein [Candidatus Limnocylindria bacterium]
MIKKNVGRVDREIRQSVGAVLAILGLVVLGGLQGQAAGLAVSVLALLGLLTGDTGRCPLYQLLGISTLGASERDGAEATREEAAA